MDSKGNKIGLALSGGGYRAAAYHIGTLRALNKLGIFDKVDVISSVSGGSITAAYYALNKDDYENFEASFIAKLQKSVMDKVWCMLIIAATIILSIAASVGCAFGLHFSNVWLGLFVALILIIVGIVYILLKWYNNLPISDTISKCYDKIFFQKKTLSDLPETPMLTINATNIATNQLFNFSRNYMGECTYTKNKQSIFNASSFPISKAVMASSCVPYGFTPIKIDEKYLQHQYSECEKNPEAPLLIDGGIYDNQGAHKLSEKKSRFHSDLIIVSDAGNGDIKAENTNNPIITLYKTTEMMMDRIKKLQAMRNIYEGHQNHSHYAYAPLKWKCSDWLIDGFLRNLVEDNVHPDVWRTHRLLEEEVESYKSNQDVQLRETLKLKLKESIGWNDLLKKVPTAESEEIAKDVGTNLTALTKSQIKALIAHSEWITEAQVTLYLPFLMTK